jgi:copper transport protein
MRRAQTSRTPNRRRVPHRLRIGAPRRPFALGLIVALALVAAAPRVALAHARLKRSSPANGAHLGAVPPELRLDFTESPELAVSTLRLTGPDGREIPLGPLGYPADSHRAIVAAVSGLSAPGSYTVSWRVVGDDGHPTAGQFTFVIAPGAAGLGVSPGARPPASGMHRDPASMPAGSGFGVESPAYVLVRWVEFAGLLLAIGATGFRAIAGPAARRAAPTNAANAGSMLAEAGRRAARQGAIAALSLAIALVLRLVAQSYAMHGAADAFDPALLATMVRRTAWGRGWLVQLVGIGLAALGYVRAQAPTSGRTSRWWTIAATGTALAALAPALSGHAASAPRFPSLMILADWLHVMAAGSWLGTLAVLLFAGVAVARPRGAAEGVPFVRELVLGFSPLALVCAAVVTLTGIFAAWIHVGTIPNLWSTRYGATLLVKLGLLCVVALVGFYNWRFVQPRLATAEGSDRLRRAAALEVGVALLVLLVTAVLVASPTSMDVGL